MRIYVAGKYEEMERVREVQDLLTSHGHHISFDWTRTDEGFTAVQAARDMHGVRTADALVLIVEKDLAYKGAYVEMGMALMAGIPVYILGKYADKNLFTMLPQVHFGIDALIAPTSLQAQRHLAVNRGELRLDVLKAQV